MLRFRSMISMLGVVSGSATSTIRKNVSQIFSYNPLTSLSRKYASEKYDRQSERENLLRESEKYKNNTVLIGDPTSREIGHHYKIKNNSHILGDPKKVIHYKGGEYMFLGEGIHTETEEELVFYYASLDFKLYARPKNMFHDYLEYKGENVKRFVFVNNDYEK